MRRFQVAEKPEGPWLELITTDDPQKALDHIRANFDWRVVWVALMRPLYAEDLIPDRPMFEGEARERIATRFGMSTASQFEEVGNIEEIYTAMSNAVDDALDRCEMWVPDIKRPYGPDQQVKPDHFMTKKPRLEDLING